MSTILAILLAFFKVVEVVMGRLDEANRRKLVVAATRAMRIEVEDEVISRSVAAFGDAMSQSDDVRKPGRYYRD